MSVRQTIKERIVKLAVDDELPADLTELDQYTLFADIDQALAWILNDLEFIQVELKHEDHLKIAQQVLKQATARLKKLVQ